MSEKFRPVTAITMGDPAGIGPEIVVGTMLDKEIHECCRPFVIGSEAIMERAAKILGKELKYNKISDPSEAKYEYGVVDILETGDYDTDSIEWGKEQKLAVTGTRNHRHSFSVFQIRIKARVENLFLTTHFLRISFPALSIRRIRKHKIETS